MSLLKEIEKVPAFREISWIAKLTLVTGFFRTSNAKAATKAIEAAKEFCEASEISHEDLCKSLCTVIDNSGRGSNFVEYLKALSAAMTAAAPPPQVLIQPRFTTQPQPPQQLPKAAEAPTVESKPLDQLVVPRDRVASPQIPQSEKPTVVVDIEFPFEDLAEVRRLIEGPMVRAVPRGSVLYTRSELFDGGNRKVTLEVLNSEPSPVMEMFIVRKDHSGNYSELECSIEPQSVLNDTYQIALTSQNVVVTIH